MNDGTKLAAFGVGALALFGAAFGIGRAVGPVGEDDPAPHRTGHTTATVPVDEADGAPSVTSHPAGHEEGQP